MVLLVLMLLPALAAAAPLTPALALARYQAAMSNLRKPQNVVFEYAQTRSGPHRIITEIHRVYRDQSGDERNETISVNGSKVAPPITHTYHARPWPYDADKFAAMPGEYDLTPNGRGLVSGKSVYAYIAKRRAPASFSIEALYLAVDSGLPVRARFAVSGPTCSGHGSIDFGAFGSYWLPVSVAVGCGSLQAAALTGTPEPTQYRETLKFSNYSFPALMPQEIFNP